MGTDRFAVIIYREPLCEDDVMIPEVVTRFPTFEEAEAYRVKRFSRENERIRIMED